MFKARRLYLVKGAAEGGTVLNAFDNALLAAGIGDVNLIKVSSIVPPGAEIVYEQPKFPKGAFVPCVLVEKAGDVAGQKIAVALAVGLDEDGFGVVMESEGETEKEAANKAQAMVEEAFRVRGLTLKRTLVISCEHVVERVGCVVCACVYG